MYTNPIQAHTHIIKVYSIYTYKSQPQQHHLNEKSSNSTDYVENNLRIFAYSTTHQIKTVSTHQFVSRYSLVFISLCSLSLSHSSYPFSPFSLSHSLSFLVLLFVFIFQPSSTVFVSYSVHCAVFLCQSNEFNARSRAHKCLPVCACVHLFVFISTEIYILRFNSR